MVECIFKIVVAGDGGVGKTTLLEKFITGTFHAKTKMTIGVQFRWKEVRVAGLTCHLQLWDLGGEERFRFILSSYVRGARGALLLFDTTRPSTLNALAGWVDICRAHDNHLPILLCGSKTDRVEDRSVPLEIAWEYLDHFDLLDYLEVSAKTGQNVGKAFEVLVTKMIEKYHNPRPMSI